MFSASGSSNFDQRTDVPDLALQSDFNLIISIIVARVTLMFTRHLAADQYIIGVRQGSVLGHILIKSYTLPLLTKR